MVAPMFLDHSLLIVRRFILISRSAIVQTGRVISGIEIGAPARLFVALMDPEQQNKKPGTRVRRRKDGDAPAR